MRIRSTALAAAICAALSAPAHAVDFSYSGFSTAAYAATNTDEAQVGYIGQPEGIDSDGSWAIDSKLGVQVTARFNDFISATVQGVGYADLTADWEPHLDWAYVRLQPTSNVSARVGYMRAPTFMYSDSVFIGYANTWVRPPLEVYNLAPAYQLQGVDFTWRGSIGAVSVTVNPYAGDSELDVGAAETKLEVDRWTGLAASAEYKSLTARVAYSEMKLGTTTPQLETLISMLRTIPAAVCGACASEADNADLAQTNLKIFDLGAQYDDGTNVVIAEYAQRRSGNYVVIDMHSAYATYGRRFGGFMPYATLAMARRDADDSSNKIPAVGGLAPLAAGINSTIRSANDDQDSYSVGVRYEVPSFAMVKSALIKVQYDYIDAKDGRGMLNAVQSSFGGTLDMFSVSFDFIF
jgi:hypothetical protein